MKRFIRAYSMIILIASFLKTFDATSQRFSEFEDGYYSVVGTFRFVNNAVAYRQTLMARGFSVQLAKDPISGLHYVHFGKAPSKENAIATVMSLRMKAEFKDAWVKTVGQRFPSSPDDAVMALVPSLALETDLETPSKNLSEYQISNTEVFLHMYNAANDKMIDGTVEIIDTERSRLIEKTKGNNYYVLPDPRSSSKRITMIGEVFGYRKLQNEISYPLDEADNTNPNLEMVGTIKMIRFDMVRYVKGDINVLYNVYFYHDAAVMQSESKYELNRLLDMLVENPRYRIRLHGHTNGNHAGKYFYPAKNSDLFNLAIAKEGFGPAKELAARRAEVIKDFLVNNGIAADRIEIKSWGGKKPLYDKESENAKKNLRVEVEILEE